MCPHPHYFPYFHGFITECRSLDRSKRHYHDASQRIITLSLNYGTYFVSCLTVPITATHRPVHSARSLVREKEGLGIEKNALSQ